MNRLQNGIKALTSRSEIFPTARIGSGISIANSNADS